MASATDTALQSTARNKSIPGSKSFMDEAAKWATIIRIGLTQLNKHSTGEDVPEPTISKDVLAAPRSTQSHPRSVALASLVASLIYPTSGDKHAAVVHYERDIATLREALRLQRVDSNEANPSHKNQSSSCSNKPRWTDRVLVRGRWDQTVTPEMLQGAPSLPMPVEISDAESLSPFFKHLQQGGSNEASSNPARDGREGREPFYDLPLLEFEKGVLYADRRMDLCKMSLGPPNIVSLMQSLKTNEFVQHFLLGNNIIGPTGALAIAEFILQFPNRIDTWYLAGNCIESKSFSVMVDALVTSPAVTNLWLKRNPLGPNSVDSIFRVITETPNLRTIDLDQTELGDAGVAALFAKLATHVPSSPLPLRIMYLSAVGISTSACEAIASYLLSPNCVPTSLYLSNNPIGDAGANALANGFRNNESIQRISLKSAGLTDEGIISLISSLHCHPAIQTVDLGQSFASEDLGSHYNCLSSEKAIAAFTDLLVSPSTTLSFLSLGPQPISAVTAAPLLTAALQSKSLLHLSLKPLIPSKTPREDQKYKGLSKTLSSHFLQNIRARYNSPTVSYKEWDADLKKWCVNDEASVRKIDSVYRNRATQKARKGEELLNKWWGDADRGILDEVMSGYYCVYSS